MELMYMDQWIQKRGILRNKDEHKAHAMEINRNAESKVKKLTKEAFQHYEEKKNVHEAFKILMKLQGVDLARASLLLSVAYPDTIPFFSESLYNSTHWNIETGWEQTVPYSESAYDEILQKVEVLKNEYATGESRVRAVDIEKVAFVMQCEATISSNDCHS
ncbi:hypothetical protein M434DRAFT_11484 [Hypoxylon sp. CO27-5]|nr:hypothetical protein M434DRAFT_11484 [Hypoxylon sp. CO27-5]